jgi:orotate phosphoribosyltransferase
MKRSCKAVKHVNEALTECRCAWVLKGGYLASIAALYAKNQIGFDPTYPKARYNSPWKSRLKLSCIAVNRSTFREEEMYSELSRAILAAVEISGALMQDYKQAFFELALSKGILRFGEFTLKSGRVSPYFFNAGGFDDGASLMGLCRCYAAAIMNSGLSFDMLFGPAYKGIPLAAGVAMVLGAEHGTNLPYAYNRKEAKDHGEGGNIVGSPLQGRVLIVDDVISAGTSVRESLDWIRQAGATPCGVLIALDRQERGKGSLSAAREVEEAENVPVISVAGLDDLIGFLENHDGKHVDIQLIRRYRKDYGC